MAWPSIAPAWRQPLAALALLLLGIVGLFRETAGAMVAIWWRSETFTHAFLVPPIVLWLVWRKRHELAALTPRVAPTAALAMLAVGFAWLLGDLAAVNAVTQLALVTLLVLGVVAVLGWAVARTIAFALGFLYFAVPLGEFLLPQFMLWTADFTVAALRASGIPVYREGMQFVIPSGTWSVVEACSGVRYLIASLVVGTLFAHLNFRSTRRRLVFVGVSMLVPIVANWLRAYMIVMLGHLSGNRIAVGVDHLIYGWVFFGVVIFVMFAIGARWREAEAEPAQSGSALQPHASRQRDRAAWGTALAALVVAALPHAGLAAIERAERDRALVRVEPLQVAGWRAASADTLPDWRPAYRGAAAETSGVLVRDGHAVGLYIGYYRHQDYERKLIASTNTLVGPDDRRWALRASGLRTEALSSGPLTLHESLLRGSPAPGLGAGAQMLRVWRVYWVAGRLTASEHLVKLWNAWDRLRGRGDDAAVLVFYAPELQPGDAVAPLQSLLAEGLPGLMTQLAAMRDGPLALAQRP